MDIDLSKKEWPKEHKDDVRYKDEKLTRAIYLNYNKSPFVSEGRIYSRVLGYKSISKPIPPGECAITSLTKAVNGKIYGVTSGNKSHLFVFDPNPDSDTVIEIGIIEGEKSVRRSLVACPDGRIFGGTGGGYIFSYDPDEGEIANIIQEPNYMVLGGIKKISIPVKGEGIACLVMGDIRNIIYGISDVTGKLFKFNISDSSTELIGEVDETGHFSECVVVDGSGNVWGTKREGLIYRYSGAEIINTGLAIPAIKGREYYNKADSLVYDESKNVIYGGTDPDGLFFILDLNNMDIRCTGKPVLQPRIKALCIGCDSRVFGVGGEEGGMAHLFEYNTDKDELRDLGIPLSTIEEKWYGYEFSAMVTGNDGEIYLGESDRMSHLFIYHPKIHPHQKHS